MPFDAGTVKRLLYQHCLDYVNTRISSIEQAIVAAQQASADDTKSSAGDKYETTREMMQQETSRNTIQLAEAGKMKVMLGRIRPDAQALPAAGPGSLVITNQGNFYIAIGAGSFNVEDAVYHTVSPASPIAFAMQKLSAGQAFNLNGKIFDISAIY
ncbi:3-oxoacyl-ACP synthase [Mucilaginibacter sp.]